MKRALPLVAGLMMAAAPVFAQEQAPAADVDVIQGVEAFNSMDANARWADLEADLEASLGAALAEYSWGEDIRYVVEISDLELEQTPTSADAPAWNRMVGYVHVYPEAGATPLASMPIGLTAKPGAYGTAPDTDDYFAALVDAFTKVAAEKVEESGAEYQELEHS